MTTKPTNKTHRFPRFTHYPTYSNPININIRRQRDLARSREISTREIVLVTKVRVNLTSRMTASTIPMQKTARSHDKTTPFHTPPSIPR